MISHVFISYSRKDSEAVDRIVARLEAENLTIWIDREDIHGGELWREAIVEAVDNTYAFVLMLSPNSVASDNVRKEVDLAEGAGKTLLPTLVAQAQLPPRLRYQLAGIQWIEYYRDPDGKLNELVSVLRGLQQKYGMVQTVATRQVELVFNGLDLSKLSPEERQQLQERVLDIIATSTNTPRTNLNVVAMSAGSVHVFVDMPARVAYQVKTAALNKDPEFIRAGIDALRLSGDRDFVSLKSIPKVPPKSGQGGCRRGCLGALLVMAGVAALLAMFAIASVLLGPLSPSVRDSETFTPTDTATSTEIETPTPTTTETLPATWTPTTTLIPTDTPTDTPTPIPNFPAVFSYPFVSSDNFHGGGDSCGTPKDETINVGVTDPEGVVAVQIYFRVQNKKTGEILDWNNLPMVYRAGFRLPSWVATITPNDIAGNPGYGDYWFQFYFLATDKTGAQTKSDLYENLVTYQYCTFIT